MIDGGGVADCIERGLHLALRGHDYRPIRRSGDRLAFAGLEERVVLLEAHDRKHAEAIGGQLLAVRWPERIDGIAFDLHWLRVDQFLVDERRDEVVRGL